jgi:hypothetical protein
MYIYQFLILLAAVTSHLISLSMIQLTTLSLLVPSLCLLL